ncbi:uncharacterized protein LOC126737345 [Anthonomus grandis grandis]|uniref:uncharacterized protein LOC126737345 n=1 Tax=Anthonomus grandis grandis TaxID=2921223 RepID=UPI00216580FE|nr:uncharacterized protein LOC126737345 [Anthonomus grandis grandis]
MYFILKYMDYEQHKCQEFMDEDDCNTEFENKTLLINPDCPIGIIRDYIATNLQFSEEETGRFDLSTEKAILLNIQRKPPTECGLEFLINMETYYIILPSENGQQDSSKLLIPLLNRFSKEYLEFMAQQRRRSSSIKIKRKSSNKTSNSSVSSAQSLLDGKTSSKSEK